MRRFQHGSKVAHATLVATLGLGAASSASAVMLSVTVENLAPTDGVFLTPVWVGFHDGSFDLYNSAEAASAELERLAEDGNTAPLSAAFAASSAGSAGGTDANVFGPGGPFSPGHSNTVVFDLDPAGGQYFSYASMVIPSNDAFIANGNPLAHRIFDDAGNVIPMEILILGTAVLDAGTEVNTEEDAAFLNQSAPDTGIDENGVVGPHPGFNGSDANPLGTPMNILGATTAGPDMNILIDATAGDFSLPDYTLARITIAGQAVDVPVPAPLALMSVGLLGMVAARRKRD